MMDADGWPKETMTVDERLRVLADEVEAGMVDGLLVVAVGEMDVRIVMQPPAGAARKRLLDGISDGLKEVLG